MPFDAEVNDNFNCGSVIIQNNSLNNKTRLRFRCDGEVYLDEITISATKSGKTGTRFIVDIASGLPTILCEIDEFDGSLEKSYVYTEDGGQILAQYVDPLAVTPDIYFYLHDRLGSVRMILDELANVVNTYTYNPFGEDFPSECTETIENPFKYTGQYHDEEINQYYLRARMYDPTLMRFTTRDPVRGKFKEPLTLHKYLYCVNDPTNRIDLNGRVPWMAIRIVVGGLTNGISNAIATNGPASEKMKAFAVGAAIGCLSSAVGDWNRLAGAVVGIGGTFFNNAYMSNANGENRSQRFGRNMSSGMGLLAGAFGMLVSDRTGNMSGLILNLTGTLAGNHLGDVVGGLISGGSGLIGGYADDIEEELNHLRN